MPKTRSLLRWFLLGLLLPLVFLNGWLLLQAFVYFESLLSVFVVATLISFLLNYPVRWLEQGRGNWRVPRGLAVLAIAGLTLALVSLLALTLGPLVVTQIEAFAQGLPAWLNSSQEQLNALSKWAVTKQLPFTIEPLIQQAIAQLSTQVQSLTSQLLSLLVQTAGRAFDVTITAVLTLYLLLKGDSFWDSWFCWLPARRAGAIRACFRTNFRNYYAGQAALAAVMGSAMLILFLLMQIPFGGLFATFIGVMTLFPFGAPLGIFIVGLFLALKSVWLGAQVLFAAFLVDQAIENFIAPRLLGQFTGLNPVWVLVSLLVGAKIAGILGVILAVPLAGSIKGLIDLATPRQPIPQPSTPNHPLR